MTDREKVIEGLKRHYEGWRASCDICPYKDEWACQISLCGDALALLKDREEEEEERYADMVLSWLMEIALNNSDAREEMLYIDAITDIRNRAKTGLKQYFIDKQKGQC